MVCLFGLLQKSNNGVGNRGEKNLDANLKNVIGRNQAESNLPMKSTFSCQDGKIEIKLKGVILLR